MRGRVGIEEAPEDHFRALELTCRDRETRLTEHHWTGDCDGARNRNQAATAEAPIDVEAATVGPLAEPRGSANGGRSVAGRARRSQRRQQRQATGKEIDHPPRKPPIPSAFEPVRRFHRLSASWQVDLPLVSRPRPPRGCLIGQAGCRAWTRKWFDRRGGG